MDLGAVLVFVPKRKKEKYLELSELPLELDMEEYSPSDWTWIFMVDVRMCFRFLQPCPSLFFQWCSTKLGFQIPVFKPFKSLNVPVGLRPR